jgi:hypothetical protein
VQRTLGPARFFTALELSLEGTDLLLRHGEACPDLVDAAVVALIACEQRLPPLQHLVGHAAEGSRQPAHRAIQPLDVLLRVFGDAAAERGELVILGVQVRRHLLQIHDQP